MSMGLSCLDPNPQTTLRTLIMIMAPPEAHILGRYLLTNWKSTRARKSLLDLRNLNSPLATIRPMIS